MNPTHTSHQMMGKREKNVQHKAIKLYHGYSIVYCEKIRIVIHKHAMLHYSQRVLSL